MGNPSYPSSNHLGADTQRYPVVSSRHMMNKYICSTLIPLPFKNKHPAQWYSCKLCPTHQNVRACVSADWNTRQRIARSHLLHREKASLLDVDTHNELHKTKTLSRKLIVAEYVESDLSDLN